MIDKIKILKRAIFFTIFLVITLLPFGLSAKNYTRSLVVVAEPNMFHALTKIARIYSRENNVVISVSFDSSNQSIDAIDSGEGIDLLISANYFRIKELRQKGLFDIYNSPVIAFDRLSLVTPVTNSQIPAEFNKKITIIEAIKTLSKNNLSLMIDREESFLGRYSQDLIDPIHDVTLRLDIRSDDNKNQLIDEVADNNYAIVLASQTKNRRDLFVVNNPNHDDISYQALIIAGENMELTREFVKFLQDSEAKKIFSNSGFLVN